MKKFFTTLFCIGILSPLVGCTDKKEEAIEEHTEQMIDEAENALEDAQEMSEELVEDAEDGAEDLVEEADEAVK